MDDVDTLWSVNRAQQPMTYGFNGRLYYRMINIIALTQQQQQLAGFWRYNSQHVEKCGPMRKTHTHLLYCTNSLHPNPCRVFEIGYTIWLCKTAGDSCTANGFANTQLCIFYHTLSVGSTGKLMRIIASAACCGQKSQKSQSPFRPGDSRPIIYCTLFDVHRVE